MNDAINSGQNVLAKFEFSENWNFKGAATATARVCSIDSLQLQILISRKMDSMTLDYGEAVVVVVAGGYVLQSRDFHKQSRTVRCSQMKTDILALSPCIVDGTSRKCNYQSNGFREKTRKMYAIRIKVVQFK